MSLVQEREAKVRVEVYIVLFTEPYYSWQLFNTYGIYLQNCLVLQSCNRGVTKQL